MASCAPSDKQMHGNEPITPQLFNSPASNPNPTDAFEQSLINLELDEVLDADGEDSDMVGEENEIFEESNFRSTLERSQHDDGSHLKEVSSGDIGFILCKRDGQFDDGNEEELLKTLPTAPKSWEVPTKISSDEPDFENVDNPGNWSQYIF